VVHAARRRGVESFTEEEEPPGGTKRFGALSTVCGEDSNAPGRERNYRSGQSATVFGALVDLRGGRGWQREADDQPGPPLPTQVEPLRQAAVLPVDLVRHDSSSPVDSLTRVV